MCLLSIADIKPIKLIIPRTAPQQRWYEVGWRASEHGYQACIVDERASVVAISIERACQQSQCKDRCDRKMSFTPFKRRVFVLKNSGQSVQWTDLTKLAFLPHFMPLPTSRVVTGNH